MEPGDPGPAAYGRDDRGPSANRCRGDDSPMKLRADDRFVDHRVADGQLATGMKTASRACACPRRAPIGASGRDDASVARHLAGSLEWAVELHDRDAPNSGVFRVDDVELLARGEPDSLAGYRELALRRARR